MALAQEDMEYITREFRYTWHSKYHRYIEDWIANATDAQKEFIHSWARGFMSPAVDPEVKWPPTI